MTNKTRNIISAVTISLVVYVLSIRLDWTLGLIFSLFIATTLGLLWMVYAILTDTSDLSGKTFDEYFYEDGDPRD